jgi:hypothetical protein
MSKESKKIKDSGVTKIILMGDGKLQKGYNEYSHQREIVKLELRRSVARPVDQKVFAKTKQEKLKVKGATNSHNRMLRKHGLDPKKYMNLPLIY